MSQPPLTGYTVADLSSGIAGGYCTKILADAGADVIKIEDPAGDWTRTWTACDTPVAADDDSAVFQFLAGGKRSLVVDLADAADQDLLTTVLQGADAIVWTPGSQLTTQPHLDPDALSRANPAAVVCAITPFGLTGPWAQRPASEATLQAMTGALMTRGDPGRPPVLQGGDAGEWISGMTAAAGMLIARWHSLSTGTGDLVDVSTFEAMVATMCMHPMTYAAIAAAPMRANRLMNVPAIHATRDGFVGFMVVTGQQWLDFCVLVDCPQWHDDESLVRFQIRTARRIELVEEIERWTRQHTTAEVLELAEALRVPAAEVGNGASIPRFDQLAARDWYVPNPRGGFLQPDVPYTLSTAHRRAPAPAPRLGADTDSIRAGFIGRVRAASGPRPTTLPFQGLRVLDVTNNWAGPEIGRILALFGAEVIHIESPRRPDPIRNNSLRSMTDDLWWEWSPQFHGPNANKLGLTLDLSAPAGKDALARLVRVSDVFVENFSPRVVESWGFDYPQLHALNPAIVMLRAPAWGTSGPWRDRTGYAQTMEMASGLAWMTGWPDQPPEIPNGAMDPIAGTHGLIALLLALEHRRRTGEGMLVEAPMIGGALNIGAQQVIETSAYGQGIGRIGNRSWHGAPQGAYRTADPLPDGTLDRWVVISIQTDRQWAALCSALGNPDVLQDPALHTVEGRRRCHDTIDASLADIVQRFRSERIVELLTASGVPAAVVLRQDEIARNPQLAARQFVDPVEHPIVGHYPVIGFGARLGTVPGPLNRFAAPLLGADNKRILTSLAGYTNDEVDELQRSGVIGTSPANTTALW